MFIFKVHGLVTFELIALAIGCALLIAAHRQECCRKFLKAMAYFIIVVTFLTMICTVYQGIRLGCEYKHRPHGMMGMHGMGMMKEMMEECPMVKDCPMMKGMMGGKSETAPAR